MINFNLEKQMKVNRENLGIRLKINENGKLSISITTIDSYDSSMENEFLKAFCKKAIKKGITIKHQEGMLDTGPPRKSYDHYELEINEE